MLSISTPNQRLIRSPLTEEKREELKVAMGLITMPNSQNKNQTVNKKIEEFNRNKIIIARPVVIGLVLSNIFF